MPVIPYVSEDISEPRDLVEAIRARRGGRLINLDRMLLHSPALAGGWNDFLRTIRTRLDVSSRLRELAICAVARLNGAEYEFFQHAPFFLEAGGTAVQAEALGSIGTSGLDVSAFDALELAVLQLTVEMTRAVQVRPETMASIRAALPDDRHVVEIVGVIATYNMVSRFLVALGVEPEGEE
jgi:alkylhydroperoxidase family enzyme